MEGHRLMLYPSIHTSLGKSAENCVFTLKMDHIFSVHIMQEKLEIKATILDLCLS